MILTELSETKERSIMKRLFGYVYASSVNDVGCIDHRFDSTWEQVCRFLGYFDPQGKVHGGYRATKHPSQIMEVIDTRVGTPLPPIEAFLDVALCLHNHLHGVGEKTLQDRMRFDPELHSILVSLGLLTKDGTASKPLLLDAIDRYHFFDPVSDALTAEADAFVHRVSLETWEQASPNDRAYLRESLANGGVANGVSVEGWFSTRWHLGEWLIDDRKKEFIDLFGSHGSLSWLIPRYIKNGWLDTS